MYLAVQYSADRRVAGWGWSSSRSAAIAEAVSYAQSALGVDLVYLGEVTVAPGEAPNAAKPARLTAIWLGGTTFEYSSYPVPATERRARLAAGFECVGLVEGEVESRIVDTTTADD